MTADDVRKMIAERLIGPYGHWMGFQGGGLVFRDYEACHGIEDQIHLEVLKAIANREAEGDPAELAKAALTTELFDFPRHCA